MVAVSYFRLKGAFSLAEDSLKPCGSAKRKEIRLQPTNTAPLLETRTFLITAAHKRNQRKETAVIEEESS